MAGRVKLTSKKRKHNFQWQQYERLRDNGTHKEASGGRETINGKKEANDGKNEPRRIVESKETD